MLKCPECGALPKKFRGASLLAVERSERITFDCQCETYISVYVNVEQAMDIRIDY